MSAPSSQRISLDDIEAFVRATGGGRGNYEEEHPKHGKHDSCKSSILYFQQTDKSEKPFSCPGLGYGRIKFLRSSGDPKPYVRVPWNSKKDNDNLSTNPQLLLHFVETVWGLPRPKLLVSVTGGAMNFPVSDDLELVLSDLIHFSRRTHAWLTTGGTYAGIMKLLGQARYRFGAKIPLLGIASWGSTAHAASLEVENNSVNFGYMTKAPVEYHHAAVKGRALLDPNHSHFILVDDGSEGKFGTEIELRGQFEACACGSEQRTRSKILNMMNSVSKAGCLGWEGVKKEVEHNDDSNSGIDPPTAKEAAQAANDDQQGSKTEKGLAICLCVEGGPGTIGTVQGTGRAADLIAEAVEMYEEGVSQADHSEEGEELVVLQRDQGASLDKMVRVLLIKRALILLGEIQNFAWRGPRVIRTASASSTGAAEAASGKSTDWYPSLRHVSPANLESMDADMMKEERWPWKREAGEWRWMEEDGSVLTGYKTLDPGSIEHLCWTLRVGYLMLKKYKVEMKKAADVLKVICQLYDAVVSRRCMVYRLGSRRKVDGKWVQVRVDEFVMRCLVQCGMLRDTELKQMRYFWDKLRQNRTARPRSVEGSPAAAVGCNGSHPASASESNEREAIIKCSEQIQMLDKDLQSRTLRLLIEWDKPELVLAMLHDIGDLSVELLTQCLELAIVNNKCDIAAKALDLGANVGCYNTSDSEIAEASKEAEGSAGSKAEPKPGIWARLLAGASDDPEERYLLDLIRRGSRKEGCPVDTAEDIPTDFRAVRILNRIYELVATDGMDEGRFSHRRPRFSFTHDENGVWAGADLNLYLSMLLVNRTDLVHLFFTREGRQNASSVLPNALWACLLCRKLSNFDGIGSNSYYLKNGFQVMHLKESSRLDSSTIRNMSKPRERFTPSDLWARLTQS